MQLNKTLIRTRQKLDLSIEKATIIFIDQNLINN